jgi:hypothetical protein
LTFAVLFPGPEPNAISNTDNDSAPASGR